MADWLRVSVIAVEEGDLSKLALTKSSAAVHDDGTPKQKSMPKSSEMTHLDRNFSTVRPYFRALYLSGLSLLTS
eukprot:COSAG01_NODE_480_length_16473_cov_655.154208_8_plen_74_part_00